MKSQIDAIYAILDSAGEGNKLAQEVRAKLDALNLRQQEVKNKFDYISLYQAMVDSTDIVDLAQRICDRLYHDLDEHNAVVIASECFNGNSEISTMAMSGSTLIENGIAQLQADKIMSPVIYSNDLYVEKMFSNELVELPSLYEFVQHSMSEEVCRKIEKELNLNAFYSYPVSEGENVLLVLSFAMKNKLSQKQCKELERTINVVRKFFSLFSRYHNTSKLNQQISEVFNLSDFAFALFGFNGKLINSNDKFNNVFNSLTNINVNDENFHRALGLTSVEALHAGQNLVVDLEKSDRKTYPLLKEYSRGIFSSVKTSSNAIVYYMLFLRSQKEELQMRESMRISENRYMRIYNHIQDVYFEVSIDGTILEISPSISRFIDLSPDNLIGEKSDSIYVNIEDRKALLDSLREKGFISNYSIDFKLPGGKVYNSLLTASLVDSGTKQERIVGSLMDITDLTAKNKLIAENEIKFRSLFNNAPVGIMLCDRNGIALDVNSSMLKAFGNVPLHSVVGKSLLENKDTIALGIPDLIQKAKSTEQAVQAEKSISFSEGKTRYFNIKISIIPDPAGRTKYLLLIVEETTDLKEKEMELAVSRDRFLDIYNNTSDLIYTMDFKGNFTSVNPVAEKWLGFKLNELPNKNMRQFISLDSAKRAEENIKMKLSNLTDQTTYEVTAFTRSNEKLILEINSFLRYKDGVPIEVFGIARDITERKNHEEIIQMTLRERERMVMEIHHRVKNNLQLIISMIKMYKHSHCDEKVIQSFNDVIQKIIAISAAHEDYYFGSNFNEINIAAYLKVLAINAIEQFDNENKVKYNLQSEDLKAGIDEVIPLGLVLSELMSNSIRYGENSHHKVNIDIVFGIVDGKHRMVFSDDGCGIPKETLDNLDNSLGLSLVSLLAEKQLGGKLSIVSGETGTTVTVTY